MVRSAHSLLIVALMLTGTLVGVLPFASEPVDALVFEIDSTEDLLGSGDNLAVLDKVLIKDGTIGLDTEVYPVHDTAWSDGAALNMVVDGQNKPKLALASHWTTKTGFDNNGDFMHSAVYDRDNSQVLVYGGVHDTAQSRFVHNSLWSYNAATGSWTERNPSFRNKFLHTAVWADSFHMMIVFGGITVDQNGQYLLDETLVYWPANDTWVLMAPCPFGGVLYHTAVWDSTNDQMLVAGGTPDGTMANVTNDLWAYRPSSNSWTRLASFPVNMARGGASSVWDTQNDLMIMYGGRRGTNNPMSSVFSYKPTTNTWTQRGNAPVARIFHSMSWDPVGNKAYSFGGHTGSAISSRLYELSPLQDSWKQLESAPDARLWTAFIWDPVNALGMNFAGAAETGDFPLTSYNDVMIYRFEVPFQTDGWLTSAIFDVAGVVSMGELSWTPTSQPGALGTQPVKFQVASSSMLDTPSDFQGPDGTADTYFTDPAGTPIGDHHYMAGRIAYRMYFHTDDKTISPTLDSVSMEAHRYSSRGVYTSPIHDLGQVRSTLERVIYRSEIPQDSNPNLVKVIVRIRTSQSDDMSSSTSWEEVTKDDSDIDIPFGRYFQFEVTLLTDSQKRYMTPLFKGISLEYNSPPVLTLGQIDEQEGDRTTWFTYTITYTDVDNDEPTVRYVYIDGIPYEMSSPDQDFTDGSAYGFTTMLELGEHEYYFEFSDGKNGVREPPGTAVYTGPVVLNRAPVPIIDFPSTGERFIPTEPVEFSAASSYDPDEDDITFRWISSISGEMSSSSAFIKKLQEGNHIITLEVTDQHGSMTSVQIDILVKAYEPVLEIRDMYMDRPEPIEKDRVTINAVIYNIGDAPASPAVAEFVVNDEVVDTLERSLDEGERWVPTFTWNANGDRNYLGVRVRHGHGADVHDYVVATVNVTANSPPVISVDVYPTEVIVKDPVNFINNGTFDPNDDALSFLWDFGDGLTSTDASNQHIYFIKGTYTVKLTVSDTRGGVSNEQWFITVKKKPVEEGPAISTMMLGAIALAVVVLLVAVFLVMGRKKGRGTGDEDADAAPSGDPAAPDPRKRPLPPPPPPPPPPARTEEQAIPGSPLEEQDNPYYQYDYGPGVDDQPKYDGDPEPSPEPVSEEPMEPAEPTEPSDPAEDPTEETTGETYDPSPKDVE